MAFALAIAGLMSMTIVLRVLDASHASLASSPHSSHCTLSDEELGSLLRTSLRFARDKGFAFHEWIAKVRCSLLVAAIETSSLPNCIVTDVCSRSLRVLWCVTEHAVVPSSFPGANTRTNEILGLTVTSLLVLVLSYQQRLPSVRCSVQRPSALRPRGAANSIEARCEAEPSLSSYMRGHTLSSVRSTVS